MRHLRQDPAVVLVGREVLFCVEGRRRQRADADGQNGELVIEPEELGPRLLSRVRHLRDI
jgi:hypothetical protein